MYVQLNTTRPPFDNPAARTALALAIDRGRLAELVSESEIVEPTCQVFPPNFPGYRPYCLHTVNPTDGVWTAPALARADELARSSGTVGMKVDMISSADGLFASAARVVADALKRLGYRVSLKTYPDQGRYFGAHASAARTAELAFNGWVSDYPAPSNFIRGVYGCNPYFCDPAIETRIRQLLSLQAHEPRAAGDQWAQLERQLVKRAIAIPLINPKDVVFASKRVGNFQRHPVFGTLISQLWVR
jgi:peptide/nickel transport system substrate-binding protein